MQGGERYGQGLTHSGPWPGGHSDAAAAAAEGGSQEQPQGLNLPSPG